MFNYYEHDEEMAVFVENIGMVKTTKPRRCTMSTKEIMNYYRRNTRPGSTNDNRRRALSIIDWNVVREVIIPNSTEKIDRAIRITPQLIRVRG